MNSTPSRLGVPALIGLHLLASAGVEAVFAWKFGHNPRAIAGHVIVLAEWDAALVAIMRALLIVTSGVLPVRTAWHRVTFLLLFAVTCTLQVYLYTLNFVSNMAWGRNITAHLIRAFAPTIWSGKEPFPVGAAGITVFACGALVLMATATFTWTRTL